MAYAGAFLTAVGGYPVGRSWAPPEIAREIADPSTHPGVPGGAATAVDEQASFGASVIKASLNSTAGPVLDSTALAAIVEVARERGLPVVAHAEGDGMPQLALDAGVDGFAHTPFSAFVGRAFTAHAVAAGQVWISTLAIHRDDPEAAEFARVNLAGFAAAGGRVLYGTDLGNGDQPVGVNPDEVAALRPGGSPRRRAHRLPRRPVALRRSAHGRLHLRARPASRGVRGDRRVAARRGRRPHRGAHP